MLPPVTWTSTAEDKSEQKHLQKQGVGQELQAPKEGSIQQKQIESHLWIRAPAAWPNWLIWVDSSSDMISGCREKEDGRDNSHFCLSSQDFRVLSNA